MEYSNVKGVIGLNTRDGQIRNQQELKDTIKLKKLADTELYQYDDPDGDYIWCIFYEGSLDLDKENIEKILAYIMDNDDERYW